MKSVLISIQPKWCELIASGKKTVEVRKTIPKLETPFKCYIYCTNNGGTLRSGYDGLYYHTSYIGKDDSSCMNGKVIGEFVCKAILPISITYSDPNSRIALKEFPFTCLTDKEIMDYLGNGKDGYGWHISDLVIYEKPRELGEFYTKCDEGCEDCDFWKSVRVNADEFDMECSSSVYGHRALKRPPQSWMYIEE